MTEAQEAEGEMWCPRRVEAPFQAPGPDRWRDRASFAGGIGPSCSYCGSLKPETFMDRVRDGWIVGPTDKSYKAYLSQPYTSEQLEQIKSGDAIWKAARQVSLDQGLPEDEATAAADAHWNKYEAPARKGIQVAKVYYQHLSETQRREFIELYNAGQMQIGYPGCFYALPFFCQLPPASPAGETAETDR